MLPMSPHAGAPDANPLGAENRALSTAVKWAVPARSAGLVRLIKEMRKFVLWLLNFFLRLGIAVQLGCSA